MNILSFLGLKRRESPLLAANHAFFADFDQNRPFADYDYVVFDTELTGFNKNKNEIVSLAAVRIRELRIMPGNCFCSYVRPNNLAATESTFIHKITPEQLEKAPSIEEVMEDFIHFCGNAFLVAHYVDLDMRFINHALKKHFGGILGNPCLCTMRLAQTYAESSDRTYYDRYVMQNSFVLTELVKKYGLPVFSAHDALHDAFQAAYLFLYLVKKLQQRDCRTPRDLYRLSHQWFLPR